MTIKFKHRDTIESIKRINPNENIENFVQKANELAELGWDSIQWSTTLPRINDKELSNLFPECKTLSDKEKQQFIINNRQNMPDRYFIEAFGNEQFSYMRSEGKSLEDCAEKLVNGGLKKMDCKHEWAYTHSNGHKTCKKCNEFTPCSVNEALENYDKGQVKLNEYISIYFHNKKSICDCGSQQVYYLQLSMLYEKQFQCPKCEKYLPLKFKADTYTSLPIHPNDDEYYQSGKGITTEPDSFTRHRIFSLGLESEKSLKKRIVEYTNNMFLHYLFIEKKEKDKSKILNQEYVNDFVQWVTTYIENYIDNSDIQIKYENSKEKLVGIKNFTITITDDKWNINYELETKTPAKENDEPEQVFANIFEALLNGDDN